MKSNKTLRHRRAIRSLNQAVKLGVAKAREKAADHDAYFKSFLSAWDSTTHDLAVVDLAFSKRPIKLTKKDRESLTWVYSPVSLIRYVFLMDNLTFEEEAQFRTAAFNLDVAWWRFLESIRARLPKTTASTEEMRRCQQALQKIVVDLYLGEEPAIFSPAFVEASTRFTSAFEALWAEVLICRI